MKRIAPFRTPVLLLGETGTGKEVAARALHDASQRRGPFVALNCGALPRSLMESVLFGHEQGAFTGAVRQRLGAIEEANHGTLFLDEIGELSVDMQPVLLRFLETGEVRPIGARGNRVLDVRVIAATNRDLRLAVNRGEFRDDLFYRLAKAPLQLPPLRDRLEDLPWLVEALLDSLRKEHAGQRLCNFSYAEQEAGLRQRKWPGNVRELKNHLEAALLYGELEDELSDAEHPTSTGEASDQVHSYPLMTTVSMADAVQMFEREYLLRLLRETNGVVVVAARRADVNRRTLFRKIEKYGLEFREE